MNDDILIQALRNMAPETGSLHCLGCGYEHGCSLHGCAVIRRAVEQLEQLIAPEPLTPLTLEELREMDGEPVWIRSMADTEKDTYSFVDVEHSMVRVVGRGMVGLRHFKTYGKTWLAYRRKPEEG